MKTGAVSHGRLQQTLFALLIPFATITSHFFRTVSFTVGSTNLLKLILLIQSIYIVYFGQTTRREKKILHATRRTPACFSSIDGLGPVFPSWIAAGRAARTGSSMVAARQPSKNASGTSDLFRTFGLPPARLAVPEGRARYDFMPTHTYQALKTKAPVHSPIDVLTKTICA